MKSGTNDLLGDVGVGVDSVVYLAQRVEDREWWVGQGSPLLRGEGVEVLPPDVRYVVVPCSAIFTA